MKTITVNVTQEHIDKGQQGLANCCPIALALRENGYPGACVGPYSWVTDIYGQDIPLTGEAQDFVGAFDYDTRSVQPIALRLLAEVQS